MKLPGVLHLTDSLAVGGAERVAVNLANLMPRDRYRVFFCTTRGEGPLASRLAPDVGRICLSRRRRFDLPALNRLLRFIRANDIRLLHAHATALFIAAQASLTPPFPRMLWHDHFGRYATEERPVAIYRLLARRASGVISVNQPLADWAVNRLRLPPNRVWYVPNFAVDAVADVEPMPLPGAAGTRIVCVANFRAEKDHLTLLGAMARVVAREPAAHLLLAGAINDPIYFAAVRDEILRLKLERHVTMRHDLDEVAPLLAGCDIGTLSSASEGLPLALLEYGRAGLPAVATDVGQCAEVLAEGEAGLVVPPRDPDRLAGALIELLASAARRRSLGEAFRRRVARHYSADAAIAQIRGIYDLILKPPSGEA